MLRNLFRLGSGSADENPIPSWVLEIEPGRIRHERDLVIEFFLISFLPRDVPFTVMSRLREAARSARNPAEFAAAAREPLLAAGSPVTLPNYFFLCCARDGVDRRTLRVLQSFEAHFEGVFKDELKALAAACVEAEPDFLRLWFTARGADDVSESRSEFFEKEYDCGIRYLERATTHELPLAGGAPLQILPKVSALLLVFNASERERWLDPTRAPRVSTRLDLSTNGSREPRIRKFVQNEIGDSLPRQLYLSDAEPEWWFTVGSQEWDDIYVPGLPCPCRAELRVTVRSQPSVEWQMGGAPPATAAVIPRVEPSRCTHLVSGSGHGNVAYEMKLGADGGASPTATLRVVSLARAFPVRELMQQVPLYNPVVRLTARLLPWPEGTRKGYGQPLGSGGRAGAVPLNELDRYQMLGTVHFNKIILGLEGERPFLEAVGDVASLVQLVRGDTTLALQPRYFLQEEDRVRITTPQGRLDLIWRAARAGHFLGGLEDTFAGGLLLDRVEKTEGLFVWLARYELLREGRTPEEATDCYLICRGRGIHVPTWPTDAGPDRVVDPILVGDPYLSADGCFAFSPVSVDGAFQVRLLGHPDGAYAERTFFRSRDATWHQWTGARQGTEDQAGAWDLATAEEHWSTHKKLQQFIVGSSLFDLTLSGTV